MSAAPPPDAVTPPPLAAQTIVAPPMAPAEPEGDICWLDPKRTRKVIVHAPLNMTKQDVARLKRWLDMMYFVDESPPAQAAPAPATEEVQF